MTLQPIGPAGAVLFVTPADLRPYGLAPGELTATLALKLARAACLEAGLPAEGGIELAAYPDPCGVLLFARFTPAAAAWFLFETAEDLIAAAHALAQGPPGAALHYYEGRFWLSLPAGNTASACRLAEFAAPAPSGPVFEALLCEHGAPVLAEDALAVLRHFFPV